MKWYRHDLSKASDVQDIDVRQIDLISLFDIASVINLYNSEYNWDEMYNFPDAINRLRDECLCFCFYLESRPIGIRWIYPITKREGYAFNLYVHSSRPKGFTVKALSKCNFLLSNRFDHLIYNIEDSNSKSANFFKKIKHVKEITISESVYNLFSKYCYEER